MNEQFIDSLTVLREAENHAGVSVGDIEEMDVEVAEDTAAALVEIGCLESYKDSILFDGGSYVWLTSKGEWVLEQIRERPLTGFDYEILGLLNRRQECPIEDIRWQFDGAFERELFDVRLRILCQEGYIQGEGHFEPHIRITEMGKEAVV